MIKLFIIVISYYIDNPIISVISEIMLTIIEVTIEYINEKKHNTENVIYNVSNYNAFYIYIIKNSNY